MSAAELPFPGNIMVQLQSSAKKHKVFAYIGPAGCGKATAIRQTFKSVTELPLTEEYIQSDGKIHCKQAIQIAQKDAAHP